MKRRKQGFRTNDKVLNAIVKYKQEYDGVAPTYREIMRMTGLTSTSVVHYHLNMLEERGLIETAPGTVRSIKVTSFGYRGARNEDRDNVSTR